MHTEYNKQFIFHIMLDNLDLTRSVYQQLKKMILNKELKPGEKVRQEKIAEQLGISRTPLARALMILENEFLVTSIPRRGVYVREFDLKEMIDIFDCREAIEGMAARILANQGTAEAVLELRNCFINYKNIKDIDPVDYAKSDDEFHKSLVRLTDNEPLDRIYAFGSIHEKVKDVGLVRPPAETLSEHFQIIDAIEEGDADSAERLIREHIRKSRQLLFDQYTINLKTKLRD